MRLSLDDTIIAPATVPGSGAIALIRVSGPKAFEFTDAVVRFRKGNAASSEGYSIHFGTVFTQNGRELDDVLVSIFRAPHSYTGEDCTEISCHASRYITGEIIRLFIDAGARYAEPGEFTRRAFTAGKMDLAQAEAVADLIAAGTEAAHRAAFMQLRGGFSSELRQMRSELVELVSLLELELDFSEEDVEFADRGRLNALLDSLRAHVAGLTDSFRLGNAIRNGVPAAIVGAANTGKSTLLNALIGEDRAIVSDIAGTTRDTVEDTVNIGGILFRFIDTAGIRDTSDVIEKLGIERTFKRISEAEIILAVLDADSDEHKISEECREVLRHISIPSQKLVFLLNKADIADKNRYNKNVIAINKIVLSIENQIKVFTISAKTGQGLPELKKHLSDMESQLISDTDATFVTNFRHYQALGAAALSLDEAAAALASGEPTDLVAELLRAALSHLGSITGDITTDEILETIFSKFCVGK